MTFKGLNLGGVAVAALLSTGVLAAPCFAASGIQKEPGVGTSIEAPAPVSEPGSNAADRIDSTAPAPASPDGVAAEPATVTEPALDGPAAPDLKDAAAPAPATPAAETAASVSANPASETSIIDLPNAAEALASASVQSKDGAAIGTVEDVTIGEDGKPEQVKIDLEGSGTLGLAASDVSFDAGNKTVIASLTESELRSLAAAQKQTH